MAELPFVNQGDSVVNRRTFVGNVVVGLLAVPLAARAQQKAMPVIGFLSSGSRDTSSPLLAAFRQGLSETGYVEGQNVAIEYRWAEGHYDRLPALAAELVGRKVDVIVSASGSPTALAAKSATSTIPIVFRSGADAVELGLVASLARPGGNLTGVSLLVDELTPKRLELLSELVPQARVIALLVNPNNTNCRAQHQRRAGGGARQGGAAHYPQGRQRQRDRHRFRDPRCTARRRAHRQRGSVLSSRREQIVALASRHAVPAIYAWREFAASGGLISYGPSLTAAFRLVGIYAGKILKGAKPADLPVEQPTKFELGDQSQDREVARHHHSEGYGGARRRGHRIDDRLEAIAVNVRSLSGATAGVGR